jgi:hypothetical protein
MYKLQSDLKLSSSRAGTVAILGSQTQGCRAWVLWRLSKFALKENPWHTQAFFFIHCLSKHILIHHFFITRVHKELSQEFCKTTRSSLKVW